MGYFAIDGVRLDEDGRISVVSCGAIHHQDDGPPYVATWAELAAHEIHTKILGGDVVYVARRLPGQLLFGSKFRAVVWGNEEGIEIESDDPGQEMRELQRL